jgi:hypothetical protein
MTRIHPRSAQGAVGVLQHILRGVYDYYGEYEGVT